MKNKKRTENIVAAILAVLIIVLVVWTLTHCADAIETEEVSGSTTDIVYELYEVPQLPVFHTRYVEKPVERHVIIEKGIYVHVAAEPLSYTEDDLYCLAAAIYQEAGGNACTDDCRRMVADVILNRVDSDRFPNTIRDVLEQEYQYGLFWKTGVTMSNRGDSENETKAISRAWYIAADVLNGNHSELYGNGYIWQAEFEQGTDNIECCGMIFGR